MNITSRSDDEDECVKLKFIGIYLLIIFVMGIGFNSSLLWLFYQKKDLRTSLNRFIFVIVSNNLIGCLIDLPFQVISSFACK